MSRVFLNKRHSQKGTGKRNAIFSWLFFFLRIRIFWNFVVVLKNVKKKKKRKRKEGDIYTCVLEIAETNNID